MTPTLCDECDGVTEHTRKLHPNRWTCIHFPRVAGNGFVSAETLIDHEPHMRCGGINGGKCPMFKLKRNGQMEMET